MYNEHEKVNYSRRLTSDGLNGRVSLLICLQLVLRDAAPLRQKRGVYLLIILQRSSQWEHSKYQISFNLKYSETTYLYSGSQAPFIDIPSTIFSNLKRTRFQQGEYSLNKKHIIIIEKHTAKVHLYSWELNNNKIFYACAPLFSGGNNIISNNFYLYLINICIITKINVPSILIVFFELTTSVWVELMTRLLGL